MQKTEIIKKFVEAFGNDKVAAINAIKSYETKSPFVGHAYPRSTDDVVVSLKSVSKTFTIKGQKIVVLNDVSLDINRGDFIAITGSSGAGKSTLLQIIGGLDKPTSGIVEIDKQDISKLSDSKLSEMRNKTIGFVFQFFYLQPFLKLRKNIEVPTMFNNLSKKERRVRSEELLNAVGLGGKEEYYPKQLSGGQLQRAAISRALMNRPKIILADEPTGNLDSKNSEAIVQLFDDMRRIYDVTVVLVTHSNEIAARADRVISMKDGKLL